MTIQNATNPGGVADGQAADTDNDGAVLPGDAESEHDGGEAVEGDEADADHEGAEGEDGQEGDQGDEGEGEQSETEAVEVEHDGKKYKVPAALKDSFLRQSDYTQKTQRLAEDRRALETRDTAQREHIREYATIISLNDQIKAYDNVDWDTFQQENPDQAASAWRRLSQLKEQRAGLAQNFQQREQTRRAEQQRETAKRAGEVQAEIVKLIPNWSDALDVQLANYGTAQGLSAEEMSEATLRNPKFVAMLNKARLYDESQAKAAKVKKIVTAQKTKPAPQVRPGTSTPPQKDPSKMSDAEYYEWRKKQDA